jgi:hypothetical protein
MDKVEFTFKWEDIDYTLAYQMLLVDGMIYSRWQRLGLYLCYVFVASLICFWVLPWSFGPSFDFDMMLFLMFGFIYGIALIMVLNVVFGKIFGPEANKGVFLTARENEQTHCVADAEGLRTQNDVSISHWQWAAFTEAKRKGSIGFVRLRKGHFVLVPSCGFGSDQAFDAGWVQIKNWIEAAHG